MTKIPRLTFMAYEEHRHMEDHIMEEKARDLAGMLTEMLRPILRANGFEENVEVRLVRVGRISVRNFADGSDAQG